MEWLGKIVDYFLTRNWTSFLVAGLCGIISIYKIPQEFYANLPFSSHDANVAVVLIAIVIAVYLILSLIQYCVNRIKKTIEKKENKEADHKKEKENRARLFEKVKTSVDSWNDEVYSAVVFLMDNQNTVPYVFYDDDEDMEETLCGETLFYCTPYNGPQLTIKKRMPGGTIQRFGTGEAHKFLLNDVCYRALKTVKDETGSISHFERESIYFV